MGKSRMMGAGNACATLYKSSPNANAGGGSKKQGVTSRVGLDGWSNRSIQVESNGIGRFRLFYSNQLGGVGVGRSMFGGQFFRPGGPVKPPASTAPLPPPTPLVLNTLLLSSVESPGYEPINNLGGESFTSATLDLSQVTLIKYVFDGEEFYLSNPTYTFDELEGIGILLCGPTFYSVPETFVFGMLINETRGTNPAPLIAGDGPLTYSLTGATKLKVHCSTRIDEYSVYKISIIRDNKIAFGYLDKLTDTGAEFVYEYRLYSSEPPSNFIPEFPSSETGYLGSP